MRDSSLGVPLVLAQAHMSGWYTARLTGMRAMQTQNRFFDDLARVAAGAMDTLSGVRSEVEARLREQLERVLAGMDLVSREEFEAVKAMAAKARAEQEDLQQRVLELESRVSALTARELPKSPGEDNASRGCD